VSTPLGSQWRILAHPVGGGASVALYSADYPDFKVRDGVGKPWRVVGRVPKRRRVRARTVFDELVIGGVLHVEQMSSNHWWINAGDLHVDVVIKKGKPVVSWWEDKKP
jgi:hypothetical protein